MPIVARVAAQIRTVAVGPFNSTERSRAEAVARWITPWSFVDHEKTIGEWCERRPGARRHAGEFRGAERDGARCWYCSARTNSAPGGAKVLVILCALGAGGVYVTAEAGNVSGAQLIAVAAPPAELNFFQRAAEFGVANDIAVLHDTPTAA